MKLKKLSNGIKIPALGLGTWGIGGSFGPNNSSEKEEIDTIHQAIKLGITHIDTAEFYGSGQAEIVIGKALREFDRKKVFITTKVWKTNLHYNDLINSLNNSLKRLQTDYVDLYIVHWPNPDIPLNETTQAMEFLAEQGKIKSIGVSNFSVSEIKEAQKYLKKYKIVANQIEHNLMKRGAEKELIPFCIKNKIMVIAYRPLGRGELVKKRIKILEDIAKQYNKTKAQIALKWLISHKNMVAVVKSTNIKHLKENIGVFGWALKQKDIKMLNRIASPYK